MKKKKTTAKKTQRPSSTAPKGTVNITLSLSKTNYKKLEAISKKEYRDIHSQLNFIIENYDGQFKQAFTSSPAQSKSTKPKSRLKPLWEDIKKDYPNVLKNISEN